MGPTWTAPGGSPTRSGLGSGRGSPAPPFGWSDGPRRPPTNSTTPRDVVVVGQVPEMEPELARADVAVVPVRYGSGTRLKILESFAHRVPVVSTTVGAEGLDVEDGVHLLVADGADAFAAACERLVADADLRRRLIEAAEQRFVERYESRVACRQIVQLVERAGCRSLRARSKWRRLRSASGEKASATAPFRSDREIRPPVASTGWRYSPTISPSSIPFPRMTEWWGTGFTEWTNVARAQPAVPRPRPATSSRGPGLLRPPGPRGPRGSGRVGSAFRAHADSAIGTIGSAADCCSSGRSMRCSIRVSPTSRSASRGPTSRGRASGTGHPTGSSSSRPIPGPRTTRATSPTSAGHSRTPATSGWAVGPILFIYKPADLPEPARFVERWQAMAQEAGLGGLYLGGGLGRIAVSHPPRRRLRRRRLLRVPLRLHPGQLVPRTADVPAHLERPEALSPSPTRSRSPRRTSAAPSSRASIPTGTTLLGRAAAASSPSHSTPERFAAHLRRAIELASAAPADEQVVMIKSWNEWAEGNYLEPDREFGRARLDALAGEVRRARRPASTPVAQAPASTTGS